MEKEDEIENDNRGAVLRVIRKVVEISSNESAVEDAKEVIGWLSE